MVIYDSISTKISLVSLPSMEIWLDKFEYFDNMF